MAGLSRLGSEMATAAEQLGGALKGMDFNDRRMNGLLREDPVRYREESSMRVSAALMQKRTPESIEHVGYRCLFWNVGG